MGAATSVAVCKRGHPQTPENVTPPDADGFTRCRVCKRDRDRKRDRNVLYLPAAPFTAWLNHHRPDMPLQQWAVRLGTDESFLRHHLRGSRDTVHIDTADRILLAAGAHLSDVYPLEDDDDLD